MNCNKCQAALPEDSKFCLKCGEKIERETWRDNADNIDKYMREIGITIILYRDFMNKNPEIRKKFENYQKKNEKKAIKEIEEIFKKF